MTDTVPSEQGENARLLLGLLVSLDRDGTRSQRHLAAELGVALGLVNAYLKRCIKKGLVKVNEAPARRYAYYLTPQGFAEKSRLTLEYLSYSFSFFRAAKTDCALVFEAARARGFSRVVIAGVSDLSEIARICALDSGITILAVVDARFTQSRFAGLPVVTSFDLVAGEFDAVVVTDLQDARAIAEKAAERFGADRVFVPALLKVDFDHRKAPA